MVFNNLWGLLALLAIPAILALHFFRSRRETVRIGGLHLWQDAATRLPVGRRWDRLLRSASLLLQLLGALLLALLIAGLDWPTDATQRHYTLVLDDSASMRAMLSAGSTETPAARATELIRDWAPREGRFTAIAAGPQARVLAGPFATRSELFAALENWQPAAPACNLEAALALGSRFIGAGGTEAAPRPEATEKMLFVTDSATITGRENLVEVAALGRPLANHAIIFADRIRLSATRDRILITARNFSAAETEVPLQAVIVTEGAEGPALLNTTLQLPANGQLQHAFELEAVNETVRVALAEDALALDNAVTLAPVPVKFVRVARTGMDASAKAITAAVNAVPYTVWAANPADASLVFTETAEPGVTSSTRLLAIFADLATTAPVRIATGNELRAEAGAPLLAGVDFNGVLWPYFPGGFAGQTGIDLWAGTEPLLRHRTRGEVTRYDFNLKLAPSNLPRQPAWPLLVRNLVEETRMTLPGMSRANFNAGEAITLNFPQAQGATELRRDGVVYATYEEPPRILPELPVGAYTLVNQNQPLAYFQVNLAAPAESDLQGVTPRKPDLRALAGGELRAATVNPIIYYALLLGAIAAVAGAWVCQDRSR